MLPVIDIALGIGSKLIDRLWPNPEEKAKAQLELLKMQQAGEFKEMEAAMNVVVAEAKSRHWLTSTWRPITMLTFVACIFNNIILAPYVQLFFSVNVTLPVPTELWELLKIGIGGYIVGRSAEKVVEVWKKPTQ